MIATDNLQPKIVEKVVRKNGRDFTVRVAVAVLGDKTYYRVVSVTPVYALARDLRFEKRDKNQCLCLTGAVAQCDNNFSYDFGADTVSPYFSLDFFISQMTRAPSLRA
jgi:hypothetical protein